MPTGIDAEPEVERAGEEKPPGWARALLVLFFLVFIVQASVAARYDSVTVDEFLHVPVGLNNLRTGEFGNDPINPPLATMIVALPVAFRNPTFAPRPGTKDWSLGYQLMQRNSDSYHSLFVSARAMATVIGCFIALCVWFWTRRLYGWRAGVCAVGLCAFEPNLLAHGHLATLDMSGTLGFLLTALATWRLARRPTRGAAIWTGAALGLAVLLKLSGFILFGLVFLIVLVAAWNESRGELGSRAFRAWGGRLLWICGVALLVLNAGYGFQGTAAPLSEVVIHADGKIGVWAQRLPWLRLPVPAGFVQGLDIILNVGQAKDYTVFFLNGELSESGWWYYHLLAFFYKTPLPFVGASLLAVLAFAWRPRRGPWDAVVLGAVLFVFGSNALFNSLQIGVRHVLPAFPLLAILIGPWIARALTPARSIAQRLGMGLALVLLLFYAGSTLAQAPRYLQYFNEAAGGPENGHRHLIDSNLDWGQDLLRLREYVESEGLEQVNLAYFGRVHPAVYDVRFVPYEPGRSTGRTVISASFLMGRSYLWRLGGREQWVPPGTYAHLQELEPVARVGSLFVFDL